MSYTEAFQAILDKKDSILNTNLFILTNHKPANIKTFPTAIRAAVLPHYFDTLQDATQEKEFVSYIPDKTETGTLQVISTEPLALWHKMLEAREALSTVNMAEILVSDYTCSGNTILMDIEFRDNSHVYFLTLYRNVSAWYSNNLRFTKRPDGKFHEEKGKILALTPYVDAVISGDLCYIINEAHFNTIFKFDEVLKNQIREHEPEIRGMNFIGDTDEFMKLLNRSRRQKGAMAKVILQNRLKKIAVYSPSYIRQQIESQPDLSFIQYDADDRIRIEPKSFNAVMGILCGNINLDLITKQLNGLEEYE